MELRKCSASIPGYDFGGNTYYIQTYDNDEHHSVKEGDITDDTNDIIVRSVGTNFDLSKGNCLKNSSPERRKTDSRRSVKCSWERIESNKWRKTSLQNNIPCGLSQY
ncbi:uncharacterized protein LOC144431308 isoform X2 [Styela clava]